MTHKYYCALNYSQRVVCNCGAWPADLPSLPRRLCHRPGRLRMEDNAMTSSNPTEITPEMIEAGVAAYDATPPGYNAHEVALGKAYLAMHATRTTSDEVERVVRDLAEKLYAHHIIKYDPAAEELCIKRSIAALSATNGTDELRAALVKIRPYVEEAGFRNHDVSGLLAEIDALLSNERQS